MCLKHLKHKHICVPPMYDVCVCVIQQSSYMYMYMYMQLHLCSTHVQGFIQGGGAFAPPCQSLAPPWEIWLPKNIFNVNSQLNITQKKTTTKLKQFNLNCYSYTFSVPYIYNVFKVTICQFVWGLNFGFRFQKQYLKQLHYCGLKMHQK